MVAVIASTVLGTGDAVLTIVTQFVPAPDRAGVGGIEAAGIDGIWHTILVRIRKAGAFEALSMGAYEGAAWTVIRTSSARPNDRIAHKMLVTTGCFLKDRAAPVHAPELVEYVGVAGRLAVLVTCAYVVPVAGTGVPRVDDPIIVLIPNAPGRITLRGKGIAHDLGGTSTIRGTETTVLLGITSTVPAEVHAPACDT